MQLLAPNGEYWRFTVAAIARAGIGSIDSTRVYSHARVAQALLQQPSGASMIIYKLRNPNRAPALASRFETLFQHSASSWQEREESTLQLFLTLRMSVAITVSLIILLAGFGIFNVLTMSVLAKIKEIAILRSMGYRRIDISCHFLVAGRADRCGRIAARLFAWCVNDLGRIAHSHSSPRFAVHELLFSDMGLETLRIRNVARDPRRVHRELCSRRVALLNCRQSSRFEVPDELGSLP